MFKYLLKRILSALITIFFIITITFFLMKAIPGDPFAAEKMPNAEIRAAMMAKYGLDQPVWKQYLIYLNNFIHGDFGVSYTKAGMTVNQVIGDGFPYSLTIGIYASLLVVFAGIGFGVVCALRQNKFIDRFFMVLATLGSTIPSFVLATGFLFLFSKTLGLVPAFGVDTVAGYIGPVVVIGAFPLSFITRLTRTSLVEVQQQDYIRTARSKGISEFKVVCKHGLRNALLPVVTYIGPMVASIVTGSFVIEKVFGIPGVGSLFTNSIINRDYPLIMGITVFFAVLLVLAVLIVDFIYVLIDPRIKLE
ncbi:peptide ABC transporter permease [Flavonifractor sp. An92]|uniref:ABC transporter permease n=1 Tax=Flavonifractor sp. An92 TaxID=1965666 RepID=UPI000B36F7E3|nr:MULTISPECIES: ABC transporter permease [unclassified Flavonifractor]OUN06106.1 peptide ABC transporter permease [Flavonifractor sp. An92]OUQ22398.1 peptide ABC transporter permease [Flavonifractor sp. An135]